MKLIALGVFTLVFSPLARSAVSGDCESKNIEDYKSKDEYELCQKVSQIREKEAKENWEKYQNKYPEKVSIKEEYLKKFQFKTDSKPNRVTGQSHAWTIGKFYTGSINGNKAIYYFAGKDEFITQDGSNKEVHLLQVLAGKAKTWNEAKLICDNLIPKKGWKLPNYNEWWAIYTAKLPTSRLDLPRGNNIASANPMWVRNADGDNENLFKLMTSMTVAFDGTTVAPLFLNRPINKQSIGTYLASPSTNEQKNQLKDLQQNGVDVYCTAGTLADGKSAFFPEPQGEELKELIAYFKEINKEDKGSLESVNDTSKNMVKEKTSEVPKNTQQETKATSK